MEQQLVDKGICLKFPDECLFVYKSGLKQGKLSIYAVIGNRAIYIVVFMVEVTVIAIGIDKVHPRLRRRVKPECVSFPDGIDVNFLNIDVCFVPAFSQATPCPLLCLIIVSGRVKAAAIIKSPVGLEYLRELNYFDASVVKSHLPGLFKYSSISSISHWWLWV